MRPDIKIISPEATAPVEGPVAIISLLDIGVEGMRLIGWLNNILNALVDLRSGALDAPGRETVRRIYPAINALIQLEPRLAGASAALIRAHFLAGGAITDLAADNGDAVILEKFLALPDEASYWEQWARRDLP